MNDKAKKRGVRIISIVLTLLVCVFYYVANPRGKSGSVSSENALLMRVLDVGQGESILISCEGENMLVDAGIRDVKDKVISAVKSVGKLDIAVATHPHSDHIGAMAEVLRACPPQVFIMPEKEHTSASYRKMIEALEDLGTDTRIADVGQKYALGGADITVLSPDKSRDYDGYNDYSVVLLIEYGGKRVLLTGDAEKEAETAFAGMIKDRVDVLKVGHHGSFSSTREELMSKAKPSYAVISCGAGNDYGYPHKETLKILEKYGARVYRTDLSGTVTFEIKESGIDVSCER